MDRIYESIKSGYNAVPTASYLVERTSSFAWSTPAYVKLLAFPDCPQSSIEEPCPSGQTDDYLKKYAMAAGVGVAAAGTAAVGVPVVAGALGFGAGGIGAGTTAASMMSMAATKGVGAGAIATLQSVGATSAISATSAAITGGAAAGGFASWKGWFSSSQDDGSQKASKL